MSMEKKGFIIRKERGHDYQKKQRSTSVLGIYFCVRHSKYCSKCGRRIKEAARMQSTQSNM